MCADTGAVLDEHQIKTYFPYGGERVFFTKDDMNQIKDFGPPGIFSSTALLFSSLTQVARHRHDSHGIQIQVQAQALSQHQELLLRVPR